MKRIDIQTGQKFGRLTALYRLHNTKGRTKWLCVCECGNFKEVTGHNLLYGGSTSCGCSRKCINSTHGKTNTRLYNIWCSMKARCHNHNLIQYKDWGGRGIAVCDEWKNDFQAFYNWAMANGYEDTLTIDRIDIDGGYEPCNCRWADKKQQSRNRRNIKQYTINNETHCLAEWCELLGLNYSTIKSRINKSGKTIEQALEIDKK